MIPTGHERSYACSHYLDTQSAHVCKIADWSQLDWDRLCLYCVLPEVVVFDDDVYDVAGIFLGLQGRIRSTCKNLYPTVCFAHLLDHVNRVCLDVHVQPQSRISALAAIPLTSVAMGTKLLDLSPHRLQFWLLPHLWTALIRVVLVPLTRACKDVTL